MSRSISDYFYLKDSLSDPRRSLSSQLPSQGLALAMQHGGREGDKRERQQHKTHGTLEYSSTFQVALLYSVVCVRAKLSSTSYTGLDSLLTRYATTCVTVKIFS